MLHHHGPSTLITRTHTDGLWSSKKVIRIKARSATEIGLNTFSRLREFPHAQRYVMQPRKSFFSQYLYVMIIITVHMASGAMIVSANKYTYICTEPGKKKTVPRLREFCSCCCFPLLPGLVWKILATWEPFFCRAVYIYTERINLSFISHSLKLSNVD